MPQDNLIPDSEIQKVEKVLWRALDELRGVIGSEDYYVILYLLILRTENLWIFSSDQDPGYYNFPSSLEWAVHMGLENRELREVATVFDQILQRIKPDSIRQLYYHFRELDSRWLKTYLPILFESLLNRIIKANSRSAFEFSLPDDVSKFIFGAIELPDDASIYNPFSGLNTFGLELRENQRFLGQEINQQAWALGYLRMFAHGKLGNSTLLNEDSINRWVRDDQKFDLIISAPPFGLKVNHHYPFFQYQGLTADFFFVEAAMQRVKSGGKVVAIVPQGFLFKGGAAQGFRRWIVEHDLLESIISLPSGLLHSTGVSVAIVILSRQKLHPGQFRFIDAKSFLNIGPGKSKGLDTQGLIDLYRNSSLTEAQTFVNEDRIRTLEYNLVVPRYFLRNNLEFNLGDIGKILTGPRKQPDSTKGKFVRVRDLKDDRLIHQLDIESILIDEISVASQMIDQSCILLATRWNTLKPTYFEYSGEPIYLSNDLVAYVPDETKVNSQFLINELHEDYVLKQLDAFRLGSVIPYLRQEDLLKIQISIPSIEGQSERLQDSYKRAALESQQLAESKLADISINVAEQNAFLRHSLAGPVSNLSHSVKSLVSLIHDQAVLEIPDLMKRKISPNHRFTFGEYLEQIQRDSLKIHDLVRQNLKEEIDFSTYTFNQISILPFLERYASELRERSNGKYSVDFDFDKEAFNDSEGNRIDIQIFGNEDLLVMMFDNLAENAEKHAFPGEKVREIQIYLMASDGAEENPKITIDFSNTGKLFPADLSFKSFVSKGRVFGPNGGSGLGGWLINRILKVHNGDFGIIDETGPEGIKEPFLATTFYLNIPISEIQGDEKI